MTQRSRLRSKRSSYRSRPSRIVDRDGHINVIRRGMALIRWDDLYHSLLVISWGWLLLLLGLSYLAANALFAIAYLLGGDCIANAEPGSFADAFFFSVQTMASIGYGAMHPTTVYANVLVVLESMVGLLGIAIATGLMFARFSRPTAQVMFSNVAIITEQNGVPTLMLRAGNQRRNQILEAQLWITLVRNETTAEGDYMRRFYDLELVRRQTPIFALTWTAMHPIDPASPLYGATPETLQRDEIEIVVILTGLDETLSQTIHARYSYIADEVLWNVRFADVLSRAADGQRIVDYTRFHDVVPILENETAVLPKS